MDTTPEELDSLQRSPDLTEDLSPTRRDALSAAGRHFNDRQTSESGPSSRAAVAVACVACRSRHLKCDGETRCGRCVAEGLQCSYVKSRRGWKGPRKNMTVNYVPHTQSLQSPGAVQPAILSLSPVLDTSVLDTTGVNTETLAMTPGEGRYPLDFLNQVENRGQLVIMPPLSQQLPVDTSSAGLTNAFYAYFFPSHPFLLPRNQMLELLHTTELGHLELAIQYIGSFYVTAAPTRAYQEALQQYLMRNNPPKDGTLVQAMLLLAVGLHISDQEDESTTVMYSALELALDLGMNQRSYVTSNGRNNSLFEESWRRTWWELFVIDGLFSGVNAKYKMQLQKVDTNMPLPCEEVDYIRGNISPITRTLLDYDDACFADEETIFSSSTYRIDTIRLLQKVLAAIRTDPMDTTALDLADTHLANWGFHLPDVKKKPMDRNGVVDEVLFEAHMIAAACTIILHRPRSDLSYEEVRDVTSCIASPSPLPGNYKDLHTAKAMRAAMDICVLIKMPCPLVKHTPFFTCAVTMAAVVYLSYWSFIATESGDDVIKEHIRLNIGVLKSLASVMPIAKTVLGQVKGVAKELFASRRALNNVYWGQVTREEILQGMIEEAPLEITGLQNEYGSEVISMS